tara:strand:- start:1722 stop:2771 length:1050 start_codon:yes stop_codon:yes gene_type:complete
MIIHTNYEDIFNISENELNKIDTEIIKFLEFWKSNKETLFIQTSGSTGKPKKIEIKRNAIINSAKATLDYFKIKENSKFHCCLPTKYIGGKMMLVRAFINKAEIILTKPTKNVTSELKEKIDFSAMTSMQVENSIHEKGFKHIKKLIIGGGPISNQLLEKIENQSTKCYQTFGMTETVSHIAIRELNNSKIDDPYECLNHVKISTNKSGVLIINSTKLNIESLTTNDLVQLTGNEQFKYIGRSDNIINSGGIKVHPETLEKEIEKILKCKDFFIDKIDDIDLGEKIIIIALKTIEKEKLKKALGEINDQKIVPKSILFCNHFYYTPNNKINRKKSKFEALKTNKLISMK